MSWWLHQTCSAQYQVPCSCPGSTVGQLQRRRQPCELALLTCTTLSFCNAAEKPVQ